MALLSVQNLSIDLHRGAHAYRLVDAVSWQINAGETLAIVGESGSGKSLTALAVMGLLADELQPGEGKILFEGQNLLALDFDQLRSLRGRQIAMVFQEPMTSLNPVKSIGYQLTEGMQQNMGLSRKEARKRAIQLLEEVGIADAPRRLRQYPHQFSGGMRQRVMIAIALACKPRLILADEPTTALDVTIQAQILALTSQLCKEHGVGLVLITHNLGIVARHAQQVIVMYGGRVVEKASARELYREPRHPYTRGLLDSVPRLDLPREEALKPIDGAPPDPFDLISGCRFHPRCSAASAQCREASPPMEVDTSAASNTETSPAENRAVACWNWRTASSAAGDAVATE